MNGGTAFHAAASQNNAAMLLLLSNYGFSEYVIDNAGKKPHVSNPPNPQDSKLCHPTNRTHPPPLLSPPPPFSPSVTRFARSLCRWLLVKAPLAHVREKERRTITR